MPRLRRQLRARLHQDHRAQRANPGQHLVAEFREQCREALDILINEMLSLRIDLPETARAHLHFPVMDLLKTGQPVPLTCQTHAQLLLFYPEVTRNSGGLPMYMVASSEMYGRVPSSS